jgi:putative peptidoglycan lipid II flippase
VSRQIRIASLIWGASILLSRVIGLVREGVIGRTLGAEARGDLYATAFTIPDFLNYLLAGGALSIVFIPIIGAHLVKHDEEGASESFSALANVLLVVLAVASTALWIFMPALAPIVAPGFTIEQQQELVALSRIMLPAQSFHVLGGLLSASLQARDRHAVPALAPLVYALCVIAGGLIGGRDAGAFGFAWGVLAGSVLGPFLMPLVASLRGGLRWRMSFALRHPDLKAYFVRSLPIMLGFSIVVVDDWYLKREGTLAGPGAAASLSYAKALMKVPMGIFGLAAGVAAFPTLQRLVALAREDEMRATLERTLRVLLVISFAAQAVLTVAGDEIVALVYGRTRIAPEQVHAIGTALALVSIGLAAWTAQNLIARGFYALGNTWFPALLGTAIAAAAYPLYAMGRTQLGINGLALASTLAVGVYTLLLALALDRALRARGARATRATLPFLARSLLALGASIVAGKLVALALPEPNATGATLLRAAILALVALTTFVLAARGLNVSEVGALIEPVTRRIQRLFGRPSSSSV